MKCQACGLQSENCKRCEVCGTVFIDQTELNEIIRETTAFGSLTDLIDCMRQGYVPSIYTHKHGSHRRKKVRLTRELRSLGFKVYDGVKVR